LLRLIWLLIFATKNLVISAPKLSGGLHKASRAHPTLSNRFAVLHDG
jgi:hypothetical protein